MQNQYFVGLHRNAGQIQIINLEQLLAAKLTVETVYVDGTLQHKKIMVVECKFTGGHESLVGPAAEEFVEEVAAQYGGLGSGEVREILNAVRDKHGIAHGRTSQLFNENGEPVDD